MKLPEIFWILGCNPDKKDQFVIPTLRPGDRIAGVKLQEHFILCQRKHPFSDTAAENKTFII
jgi:hypothetical protein